MRKQVAWTLVLGAASATVGCGGDGLGSQETELVSEDGAFSGHFSPDPDPPAAGLTTYLVELHDPSGQSVQGASLEVEPWMPGHGHGSPEPATVAELGDGAYAVEVFYNMGGYWELTVDVEHGAAADRFVVAQEVRE
ncbi:MAG: FixH family protein [Myxococcota bacterium]